MCVKKFSLKLSCMTFLFSVSKQLKIHSIVEIVGFNLMTSISLARTLSSISCNTLVIVSQVTGSFPLPVAHSRRISVLICSASPLCLHSMLLTLVPLGSFRSKMPNWLYLVPISCGMLIVLCLAGNLMHSSTVGQSAMTIQRT